jgi:hypothetical protein
MKSSWAISPHWCLALAKNHELLVSLYKYLMKQTKNLFTLSSKVMAVMGQVYFDFIPIL